MITCWPWLHNFLSVTDSCQKNVCFYDFFTIYLNRHSNIANIFCYWCHLPSSISKIKQFKLMRTILGQSLESKTLFTVETSSVWSSWLRPRKWLNESITTSFGWTSNHSLISFNTIWNNTRNWFDSIKKHLFIFIKLNRLEPLHLSNYTTNRQDGKCCAKTFKR